MEREAEMSEAMAWQTARLTMLGFHKPGDFPEFRKVFPKRRAGGAKPKTGREIMSQLTLFAAAMGGKVIRK